MANSFNGSMILILAKWNGNPVTNAKDSHQKCAQVVEQNWVPDIPTSRARRVTWLQKTF